MVFGWSLFDERVEDEFKEPTNIYYWEKNAQQYKERYLSDDVGPNEPFINRPYTDDLPPGSQEFFGDERRTAIFWSIYGGIYNQNTSIHWRLFLFIHNLVPVSFDNPHSGISPHVKLEMLCGSFAVIQLTLGCTNPL